MQMRFLLVVPLKEVAEEEGVVARLQLQALEQYHLDLVLTSQRTSCLAEEALVPLIRHRHLLEVEADLEARLAAWVLALAGQKVREHHCLDIVSALLVHQHPNFASHPGLAHRSGAGSRTMRCDQETVFSWGPLGCTSQLHHNCALCGDRTLSRSPFYN